MKRLSTCIFIIFTTHFVCGIDENDVFTLKNMKFKTTDIKKDTMISEELETGHIFMAILDRTNYLIRFDPPEHCSRVIICEREIIKTGVIKTETVCQDKTDALLLKLNEDVKIFKKNNIQGGGFESEDLKIPMYENSTIALTYTGNKLTFRFNGDEKYKYTMPFSGTLRVETSSFYCHFRIGSSNSNADEVPKMNVHDHDALHFKIGEQANMAPATLRNYLGPIFKNKNDVILKKSEKKRCPYTQDWFGYSKWGLPVGLVKESTVWTGNAIQYTLRYEKDDNDKIRTCGHARKNLYSIDIELQNVFDPMHLVEYDRCFGFGVTFSNTDTPLKIDPKQTFEFYPVSMIMLGPSHDEARRIRTDRKTLRKIRISFALMGNKGVAIVEYAFLNDRIAGVREYFKLPDNVISGKGKPVFKYATLFMQGFCNVRLLNANHHSDPLCMSIAGCNVNDTE